MFEEVTTFYFSMERHLHTEAENGIQSLHRSPEILNPQQTIPAHFGVSVQLHPCCFSQIGGLKNKRTYQLKI